MKHLFLLLTAFAAFCNCARATDPVPTGAGGGGAGMFGPQLHLDSSPHKESLSPSASLPKWEYAELHIRYSLSAREVLAFRDNEPRVLWYAGKQVVTAANPTELAKQLEGLSAIDKVTAATGIVPVSELLNALGRRGWELVSASADTTSVYFFKRELK